MRVAIICLLLALMTGLSHAGTINFERNRDLDRFVRVMPSDDAIYQGFQEVMASCDCRPRSPEMNMAMVRYFSEAFAGAGYNYDRVMRDYAAYAKRVYGGGDRRAQDNLERYGFNSFAMPLVTIIQNRRHGERLLSELNNDRFVTPATVRAFQEMGI